MKTFTRSLWQVCLGALLLLGGRGISSAQTSLAAGDLLFTGFHTVASAGVPDTFSVVLLTPISASTVIYFSDRGYNGSGWQGSGGTEGTVAWTSGTALPIGTEITIAGLGGSAATVNGVPNGMVTQIAGGNAVSGLSVGNGGDQLQAFQGGGGDPTSGAVTRIAGIHFSSCTGTSDVTWDPVACASGPSASTMLPGLTGGVNAFWAGGFKTQGKFTCAGTPFTTVAAIRSAVMNRANWIFSTDQFSSVINVPPGCLYYSTCAPPSVTGNPPNRTICANGNTTFSISATGSGLTYQWQVDQGSGFANISNGAPYSGVTTATLTITGAAASQSGFLYRAVVTGTCGTANSNYGTLTVSNPTTSGTSTSVSCFGGANGTATVTPSGGILPYTFLWSPAGGSSSTATGLSAGNYTVTVTDNIGCTTTRSYTITQPPQLTTGGTMTNVACFGGSTGEASVTASGGTPAYSYSWAPGGATTPGITNLSQGSYSVTVTDSKGCTTTRTYTVTQPPAINITPSQTNIACNGGSNGVAAASVSGGTPGYTYSWSPSGGTAFIATGLSAGNYTVTVTDANNCTRTQSYNITAPPAISTSGSQTDVTCSGANNGTATVTASGGAGSFFTYAWAPSGGTGATATGLASGNYTVTVTDANSCTKTHTFNITAPPAFSLTGSQTDVSCFGGSNGTATVDPGPGTFTYSWSPTGGTGATASGLIAGNYTVTVTSSGGCTATHTYTLTQPTAINVTGSLTNVACNGGSNGSATATASGGAGGFTYDWLPGTPTGDGTTMITGLTAGTYTVIVTDASACTNSSTYNITAPPALSTSGTTTDISCNGGSNGTATVTASGGAGGYSYSWSPSGGTNATASGLSAGNYTVTVTDANSCITTRTFNVTAPPALIVTPISQTNVICNGASTGSAAITVSGGTPGYSYSWAPSGGTGATASNLAAGNYTVTVTDANSCTATHTFNITESSPIVTSSGGVTSVACFGGSNGSATVTASGGTGTLTYSWSPSGGTGATASGLSAGSYTVTVTDASSCTNTNTFTITEPPVIATTGSHINVSCNGGSNGSATVTASGGTGAFIYSWSPSGGTGATATGLTAGSYTVTVTDANTCTATHTFTIGEPSVITTASGTVNNVSCNGGSNGSATVVASGGTGAFTYSWSPSGGSGATASGLAQDSYTVTVTDANACTATHTFTITEPSVITTASGSQTDVSCNSGSNGSATVTASGGTGTFTYSWSPSGGSGATASGLSAGSYTVTVTDANSCTASHTFTITEPSAITAASGGVTNVSCNGGSNGSATVTASGGTGTFTYSWSPSGGTGATASGLSQGGYTVTVSDANGCTNTQTFTVTEPLAITTSSAGQTNIACNGGNTGTASVTASGGTGAFTYSWAPSGGTASTATGLTQGGYTVTVTDANSCTATHTFTLTEAPAINITTSVTDATCGLSDGSASVSASGGTGTLSYSWAPGGSTNTAITGISAGTYTVTVTDVNSCTASSTAVVDATGGVTLSVTATPVACNGGNTGAVDLTVLTGTPNYSYSWSNSASTEDISSLTAGTYTVLVTDNNGCTATASASVTEPTALSLNTVVTSVSCNGTSTGAVDLTVSGGTTGYTYSWTNSAATEDISGLAAGGYTVTVTDANNCTATVSVTVTEPAALTLSGSVTDADCNGNTDGAIQLTVTGGTGSYDYNWSNSAITEDITGLTAGTYSVTVTDDNNCTATYSGTVNEPAALTYTMASDNVNCAGANDGTATITVNGGTPGYNYSWSPSGGNGATASGLSPGNYTVLVTDSNGCSVSAGVSITEPLMLVALISSHTDVSCNGGSDGTATVSAGWGTPSYSYSWSPSGGTGPVASGLAPGTYTVTVTDNNGCTASSSVTIAEPAPLSVTSVVQAEMFPNGGSADITVTGGTPVYSYSWSDGATTEDLNSVPGGTYTVTVTDANGCTETATVVIPSFVGTAPQEQTQLNIYPNPSNGNFTVSVSGMPEGELKMMLTDISGKTLFTKIHSGSVGELNLPVNADMLPAGTYFLRISTGNSFSVHPVVITK